MPAAVETKPVEDTVPKVNSELAVGADLEFQRRWWGMERIVWIIFTLIVVADLLGCFGRGYVAKAETRTEDGSMHIKYERIERFSTPSLLTIEFGQSAKHDQKIELWTSDSILKALGAQRIVPQPQTSALDGKGTLYTFPVADKPNSVEFALEPAKVGLSELILRVPGSQEKRLKIFVMP